MTTSAVIRMIGDGLSRVGFPSGAAEGASHGRQPAEQIAPIVRAVRSQVRRLAAPVILWRRREQTIKSLSRLSDHHLRDIGIERADIRRIAHQMALRK